MKLCIIVASAAMASATILQPPLGKHGVATSVMELVDTSRNDPHAPKQEHRRIMVSAYYPATSLKNCQPLTVPYMPPATAAVHDTMYADFGISNGTFGSFQLSTCAFNRKDRSRGSTNFPIALFSPGLGNTRLMYGAMAQSFASQGFVVITMDHPYDAAIVEYPDKSITLAANISTDAEIEKNLYVRRQDVSFIIDKLHDCSIRQTLFHDIADTKSLNKILMFGHSLGGATAAAAMQTDHRIAAGVNMDGRFFDSSMPNNTSSPFMILSREGHNITSDPTWTPAWSKFTGTKLFVSLNNFTHGTFTDLPLLADALGTPGSEYEVIGEILGAVEGKRADEIVNGFVGQFFDFVRGVSKDLLPRNMTKEFPEAVVLDKQIRKQCK